MIFLGCFDSAIRVFSETNRSSYFIAWVEENAESLAKADAEENETTFEEIDSIDFTEKEIDDDALFDEEYENACEFEWECQTGR